MRTWNIFDFPDTIYISLRDKFKARFFEEMFRKLGGKRPYARFLNVNQMAVKKYLIGHTYKRGVRHPQAIPLSLFKKSNSLIGKELKKEIEDNITLIKAKGKGASIINPELPFMESPAFYRIVAHIIGDGSAPGNKVPYYANACKDLREQFKKDLDIFGEVRTYERKPNTTPVVYFPKVITDILSHILKIEFTNPEHIPSQIFKASDKCKSSFLRALFDDEGTISTSLAFNMSNQNIVNEITKLIEMLGIKVNSIIRKKNREWKDNYSFSIKRKYLKNFNSKIGFSHPKKMKNLNYALKTQNRKKRTRDFEDINQEILKSLSDNKKTTLDIANKVQLTLGHTLKYLKNLEAKGIIFRRGFKNKIYWYLN